jgi:ABC-type lipoprotein export system ATPase subunit
MTGIVQARGLCKTFHMGESHFSVLKDLDFDLQAGEFVAIEGRSGSGKSTMLHILAALDSADAGTLHFEGTEYTRRTRKPTPAWGRVVTMQFVHPTAVLLAKLALILSFVGGAVCLILSQGLLPEKWQKISFNASLVLLGFFCLIWLLRFAWLLWRIIVTLNTEGPAAKLRNRQFGFIFQFYHLLPELNVLENAMLAPSIERSSLAMLFHRQELKKRATALLEQLGMSHRLKHRPSQLSGGERQRVAIARALMNNPKVLFADEPTGNLDAETGRQIMDLLEKLHRDTGQTIVMVTHDRSLAREADRVLVLKDGKLEPAQ